MLSTFCEFHKELQKFILFLLKSCHNRKNPMLALESYIQALSFQLHKRQP